LTELIIRSDKIVGVDSVEAYVPEDREETSRIAIRLLGSSVLTKPDVLSQSLSGSRSPLHSLGLLPGPRKVQLVWRREEYSLGKEDNYAARFVVVPDGILIFGDGGQLLVRQDDDLPSWLRLDWDDDVIGQIVNDAEKVDDLA